MTVDVRESFQQMLSHRIHELESQVTLLQGLLEDERAGSRRCMAPGCSNIVSLVRLMSDHSTCSITCQGKLPAIAAVKRIRRLSNARQLGTPR